MQSMNISLPDPLKDFVGSQISWWIISVIARRMGGFPLFELFTLHKIGGGFRGRHLNLIRPWSVLAHQFTKYGTHLIVTK
jgi:hypothetical protein